MAIINKLNDIVSESSINIADLRAYSYDASNQPGITLAVVWPQSTQDIQRIVRLAALRNYSITIRGAGTSDFGGSTPNDSIVIDMSRMQRVLSFNENEHLITVEAGVVIDKLNEVLISKKLYFPIIPFKSSVGTLGGAAAINAFGIYFRDGKMKDWIKEIEIIDGTGKTYVSKDIDKFIGHLGLTGVISNLTLKLKKRAESSVSILSYSNSEELLHHIEMLKEDNEVIGIEYFDKSSSMIAFDDENHLIAVEYSNAEKGEIKGKGIKEFLTTINSALKSNKYIHHVTFNRAFLSEFLPYARRNQIPVTGSLGANKVTAYFKKGDDISKCIKNAIKMGAFLDFESGRFIDIKHHLSSLLLNKTREIKRERDPKNVLNNVILK